MMLGGSQLAAAFASSSDRLSGIVEKRSGAISSHSTPAQPIRGGYLSGKSATQYLFNETRTEAALIGRQVWRPAGPPLSVHVNRRCGTSSSFATDPGNVDPSPRRERAILRCIGRELVNRDRKRQCLPGLQDEVGPACPDASLPRTMGRKRTIDDVPDRRVRPTCLCEDIVGVAQCHQASREGFTRGGDIIASHGLVRDRSRPWTSVFLIRCCNSAPAGPGAGPPPSARRTASNSSVISRADRQQMGWLAVASQDRETPGRANTWASPSQCWRCL